MQYHITPTLIYEVLLPSFGICDPFLMTLIKLTRSVIESRLEIVMMMAKDLELLFIS